MSFLPSLTSFAAPEGLTPRDPTWIGAWWLGFFIISMALIAPGLAMCFFPQGQPEKSGDNESKDPSGDAMKKNKRTLKLVDRHVKKVEGGDAIEPMGVGEKITGMTQLEYNSHYDVVAEFCIIQTYFLRLCE